MVEQHFCLRWNNYRTNITAEFETLREGEHFVDVTLACDGRQLKAHKVVLSACSPYFKELLQGNPCSHPIIILRDVAYTHMRSLLEFMYAGEVNISQVQLAAFLHTAEALKIRGLAESSDDRKDQGGMNSMSPLSALKTSLGSLSGLGLSSLSGPSILERPLVPQLLPHHTSPDKPGGPPLPAPHHLPPHLVPPPLATLPAPPPQTPGPPSTSSTSSTSSLTLATPPLPLGVVVGAGDQRTPRPDPPPDRTPSPPTPLPPSKRLRKSLAENPPPPPPLPPPDSHGDPGDNHAPAVSAPTTTTSAPITVLPPEDIINPILKTEPVESCGSDVEGGGAWCSPDDGGEAGGGGIGGGGGGGVEPTATRTPPGPTPPGGTPPPQQHPTPTDNTSHLLQALSSESHLQGEDTGGGDEARQQYEVLPEPRHPPPLDLRGGGEAVMGRGRLEEARLEERQPTSPPLPPSSLPHSCQLCGKLISCRRNLWKHMERVHFNNPAVRCSLCAKMFKNKYALKDHQRIYHGGLSEPPPPPPPPQPQSTSLLSRILQDPRHQQHPEPRPPPPHDLSQPQMLPRDSHLRHHLEPPRRRHHEEDDVPGGGGGGYHPGMGMGGMMPQALGPPTSLAPSRPDWPTQENPMSLVNRAALLSELHHLVTKAD